MSILDDMSYLMNSHVHESNSMTADGIIFNFFDSVTLDMRRK